MAKFNLTEAAKAIISEGAKETFDSNIASKRKGQEHGVGDSKVKTSVAYGEKEAGLVGQSPEKEDDSLPDYLKGTPTATPPGATPPVGSEKDGVGYTSPKGQPQQTMGRTDVAKQTDATDYEAIRDRKAGKLAPQTFSKNPGATFQIYGEDIDLTDDVNALLEGEELSAEFKEKATTIFEAAVTTRIGTIAEQIEANLVEQFEETIGQIQEDLAGKIDEYLNYMVEEWMQENKLAVDTGLKSEICEEFMTKLRDLFVESWIDIPEEKVDVVEELATKVTDLEDELNEQIEKNIQFTKQINEHLKLEAIHTACEGLTQTQVEKIKSLAESIEYTTSEDFGAKLDTILESYFPSTVKTGTESDLNEEVQFDDDDKKQAVKSSDPSMNIYAEAISKTLLK